MIYELMKIPELVMHHIMERAWLVLRVVIKLSLLVECVVIESCNDQRHVMMAILVVMMGVVRTAWRCNQDEHVL